MRLRLEDPLPRVLGLKARIGGRALFVPMEEVASLGTPAVRMATGKPDLARFERRPGELLPRADVLGRSLIDVKTARLVRAHEVELARTHDAWRVAGIDASARACMRRLLPRPLRSAQGPASRFIAWNETEPFLGQVRSSRRRLARLHPAQLADLVETASHEQGEEILRAVAHDRSLEADVLEEMDHQHRAEFLGERSNAEAASLLSQLSGNDATDLLLDLDQRRRLAVLNLLTEPMRSTVSKLLAYGRRTAGGMMRPEFVVVDDRACVGEALAAVRASAAAARDLQAVYVSGAEGRLAGRVELADLMRARETQPIRPLVERDTPAIAPSTDVPEIAQLMTDYDLVSLPVVDRDGRLIGVLQADDLLERLPRSDWGRL